MIYMLFSLQSGQKNKDTDADILVKLHVSLNNATISEQLMLSLDETCYVWCFTVLREFSFISNQANTSIWENLTAKVKDLTIYKQKNLSCI